MTWVTVDIDISELSDEEIRSEFFERNLDGEGLDDVADMVTQMAEAFYLNQDAKALELAKQVARKHTGKMIL